MFPPPSEALPVSIEGCEETDIPNNTFTVMYSEEVHTTERMMTRSAQEHMMEASGYRYQFNYWNLWGKSWLIRDG